jgi:hypothetical protein
MDDRLRAGKGEGRDWKIYFDVSTKVHKMPAKLHLAVAFRFFVSAKLCPAGG